MRRTVLQLNSDLPPDESEKGISLQLAVQDPIHSISISIFAVPGPALPSSGDYNL